LAPVCPELNLFTHNGLVAELSPLLIAIQYRHVDIVRFILEKMKVDKRLALALVVQDDSRHRTKTIGEQKQVGNSFVSREIAVQDLSDEEKCYCLLVTCGNQDLLMLRYLWETFAPLYWDLTIFKCLITQIVS